MGTSAPSAQAIALAALASLVVLAALLQTAWLSWKRFARRWTIRTRARRAVAGELRAEPMLRRAGYEVLDRQVRGGWTVFADGEPLEVGLRADLLVRREGRRYIAEVKTGRLAPRLDHAATRRQLLEYRMAFGVNGVLLVDAEAGRVIVVEIGDAAATASERGETRVAGVLAPALAIGVAVGIVVGWFLHAS